MERSGHDQTEQEELHLESQKVSLGIENPSALTPIPLQKLGALGNQHLSTSFASLTPEKANESAHIKRKQEAAELPEKYRILSEFFDRLICSIRLLTLRKRSIIFRNISVQVERLTGRIFQYRHLAQMKYILPEAVKIEKILVHDEKTLCMKPDLNIILVPDIVESDNEQYVFVALSNLFASRLRKFFSAHPEVCDIPEAELPDPFNQRSMAIKATSSSVGLSMPTEVDISNSSHLCPSFNRRFSRKDLAGETEKTQLLISHLPYSPTKLDHLNGRVMVTNLASTDSCSISNVTATGQMACLPSYVNTNACESTPLKHPSESDNITLETPAQCTPKRSIPTCESKQKTVIDVDNIASSLTAKRSLDFSHLEGEENISYLTTDGIQQSGSVQIDFLGVETDGDLLKDGVEASSEPFFKVEGSDSVAGNNHMIYQHDLTEHHQASICLLDLVPLVRQIFESMSFRSITKGELIHKIIMNNCDIDENSDIEGQIELLEKLVPDWICKKLTPSGDLLYSIKKVSDLDHVRERLVSI